jgi:hypothetical protein
MGLPSSLLTNKRNIDTTGSKRSPFSGPPQSIFKDPGIETIFRFLSQAKVRCSNTLQDIVVVLGGTEDAGRRIWNIPNDRDIYIGWVDGMERIKTNQAASTSRAVRNRIRA